MGVRKCRVLLDNDFVHVEDYNIGTFSCTFITTGPTKEIPSLGTSELLN